MPETVNELAFLSNLFSNLLGIAWYVLKTRMTFSLILSSLRAVSNYQHVYRVYKTQTRGKGGKPM